MPIRCLTCQAGELRLGLPVAAIREVVAMAQLHVGPRRHSWQAGWLAYHGSMVPVIDLPDWLSGIPTPRRLSVRIVLWQPPERRSPRAGFIVDRIYDVRDLEPPSEPPLVVWDRSAQLGPLFCDDLGVLQVLDFENFWKVLEGPTDDYTPLMPATERWSDLIPSDEDEEPALS